MQIPINGRLFHPFPTYIVDETFPSCRTRTEKKKHTQGLSMDAMKGYRAAWRIL